MAISAEIIHLASMANVLSPTNQKSFAMANISVPKTIRVIAAQKAHAPMPIYRATTIAACDVTISAHFAPMGDASRLASAIKSSAMANASIPMSTMPIAVPKAFAIRSQKTTKIIRAWLAQVARYAPKAHATSRALLGKSSAMANASIPMSTMPIAVPKAFAIRSQKTTKIIRAWLAQAATSVLAALAISHALACKSYAIIYASTLRPTTSIAVLAEGVIAIRSTVPISTV